MKLIEVGFKYKTFPKFGRSNTVHIFHKAQSGERPYSGLVEETNTIVDFDEMGKDEWFECGGYWNELLIETKEPSNVKLTKGG